MLCKFEWRTDQGQAGLIARHSCQSLPLTHRVGEFFSGFFGETWFMVKQIDLGGPAGLKKINYPLCLGRVMQTSACFCVEHIGKSQAPKSSSKTIQEISSGHSKLRFKTSAFILIHHFYLFEIVPSKFISVETRLVTAAK